MKWFCMIAALVALVAGCGKATRQDVGSQECEIYEKVFAAMIGADSTIVIQDRTERDWRDSSILVAFTNDIAPETYATLAQDFIAANAQSAALPDCFRGNSKVQMISRDTLDNIFHRDSGVGGTWERFYTRYPGRWGVLWFSRPAMTVDSAYCLTYAGHQWGEQSGMGHVFLLKRESGHWAVAAQKML